MREGIAPSEVCRQRITLSEVDAVAERDATDEEVRAVWRKFASLVGMELTGVLFSQPVDSARLADIYRVRAESHRRARWECDGFEQSVRALEARHRPVSMALLKAPHYLGVCFLTPEMGCLIGFLYLRNDERFTL